MNPWSMYESRQKARGGSRRDISLKREARYIGTKLPRNLSYKEVVMNGKSQNLAVIDSDNLDTKRLCSLPGEDFPHGGLVEWADNKWIVIAKDANKELYAKGTMRQCNCLLRWIDDGKIIERWCIVDDGTKLKRTLRAQ